MALVVEKRKIFGKLEKTEAKDFEVIVRGCHTSRVNVVRDCITTSFSFSFAGADGSQNSVGFSTTY